MNAEMAFEALVLSHDAGSFQIVNQCLRELSIVPNICLTEEGAVRELEADRNDLVLLDLDIEESSALVERIWKRERGKKPTVVALSRTASRVPGAHFVLRKPLTHQSGMASFKAIYQQMLHDYRQHARFAVMRSAEIIAENLSPRKLIVTDIGMEGLGLMTRDEIPIGSTLKVKVELPNTSRCIWIEARVLWRREYSRLGCDFLRISTLDAAILQDWIRSRIVVKKPSATVDVD